MNLAVPHPGLEALAEFILSQGCASMVVIAIYHQDAIWGCLVGASEKPRTPGSRELCVYSLLASCLAVSVESASLRAETSFRFSGAMSLQTVVSALVEEHSLDAILSVIIDETIQLLGASDALVLLIEEGEEWFQVSARTGSILSELRSTRMSMKDSLHGLVVETGEPLVSNDAFTDPRANQARARKLDVHTVAIAPLKIRHQVLGTLAVHNKKNGFFSRADVDILCSFANQAAVAIDNAKLFRELAQARDKLQEKALELQELLVATINIQENERHRIAADIHDRVISRIVGALYEVESCRQREANGEDLEEQLQMLKVLLDEAIERTRNSIYDLWPVTLDHMGLVPTLREFCSRQQSVSGTRHSLRVFGVAQDLEPTTRIAVYRIVQEALSNVIQHADASRVNISIRFGSRWIQVVIEDDGQGFNMEELIASSRVHIGLIGMRERAQSVGGRLSIESNPGRGSRVTLQIPGKEPLG
jgi:signal transduction histidine kinase